MKTMKKGLIALVMAVVMAALLAAPAMAATKKHTITSVKFGVVNKYKAGDSPNGIINVFNSMEEATEGLSIIDLGNQYYKVECASYYDDYNDTLKVGDKFRIEVTLIPTAPTGGFEENVFGSIGSVGITPASAVTSKSISSKSSDSVTIRLTLKAIGGQYETPDEAYWSTTNGTAKWEAPSSTSGYYDIYLYRNGKKIAGTESGSPYHGTSVNLYQFMTKEGDYSFKVRTVPFTSAQKEAGAKSSEWLESEEFYVDEAHRNKSSANPGSVIAGAGNGGYAPGISNVGWVKEGEFWYYRYPDGQKKTNGWDFIDGLWYLFDASGIMLTGWQQNGGQTYFLNTRSTGIEGSMKTGWFKDGGKWYYFNASKTSGIEGAMATNVFVLYNNRYYYMTSDGTMATGWIKIGNDYYYFHPEDGSMAVNTVIDTFKVGPDGKWIH